MLKDMDQMEAGIMVTKMSVVLTMLNHGNDEQKRFARAEVKQLAAILERSMEPTAYKLAALNLGFTAEEMEILEQVAV
ncbi:hypothetical protein [Paenibacillus abyssi]|uniref:Uncharacterized protein n=1 Tax=Paenibacillus abyssi TaxID=1340531 RepID=A0A917G1B4_9BACL|nr:hypothetical protein [Paenibacillus abyssi]GGG17565.1 hypothetical protein GCM10010916_37990 [Paenibacillus abyssi]